MKTASELFDKYMNQYETLFYLSEEEFDKALTEHDAEIKGLIFDMLIDVIPFDENDKEKAFREGYNKSLTELKNKLEQK